jgi:hypothetical protein
MTDAQSGRAHFSQQEGSGRKTPGFRAPIVLSPAFVRVDLADYDPAKWHIIVEGAA